MSESKNRMEQEIKELTERCANLNHILLSISESLDYEIQTAYEQGIGSVNLKAVEKIRNEISCE